MPVWEELVAGVAPNDAFGCESFWADPDENKESPRPFILPKVVDAEELFLLAAFALFPNGEVFCAAVGLV